MTFSRPLCATLLLLTFNVAMSLRSGAQTRNVSFQARRDFPAVGQAGGVVIADLRSNGSKDLVITNSLGSSTSLDVVRSNGDGSFARPLSFSTGGRAPSGIAVADVNNDGKLDVVVANQLSNSVAVLLGNGNGTLQSPRVFAVGANPLAVAVGDFNGDGNADVVVVNSTSNSVSVLLGNGDGTLRPASSLAVGISPVAVVVGRFHGGNTTDIAVANAGNTGQNNGSVSLLLGNGNGTFQAATSIVSGGSPASLVTGELNGDGAADLAIADTAQSAVLIALGNGNGTFHRSLNVPAQASPVGVTLADFHGDGKQRDIVVVSGAPSEVVTVALNRGNGTFFPSAGTFAVSQNPAGIVAADFNRDGRTDVVSASQLGNISVLLGTGLGRFLSAVSFPVSNEATYIIADDLNGDGRLDVAVANENSNTISILLGNGNGTFGLKNDIAVGSQPFSLSVGDFNGDQKHDLVVANSGQFPNDPGSISILLGNGDGTFQPARNIRVGNLPVSAAVGDFNKDGKQDLAVANFVDNTVSVLRGNGDGTFGAPSNLIFPQFSQVFQVAVADVDGDHNEDLIVGGGENVWVVKGNGLGGFSQPQLVHAGFTGEFTTADFNGDKVPDLAIVDLNRNGSQFVVDVLLGNGNGTFRQVSQVPMFGSFATQVIAADFNQDGKIDLAVSGLNTLSVDVLIGNGDGTFAATSEFGASTFAQSLAAGDFNGDGRTDIAVTGRASNNKQGSTASAVSLLLNNTP
jgi:hypothetical protein